MPRSQRNHKRIVVGSAVTLLLALIVAMLTLAPISVGGAGGADKMYHAFAFASLAFPLSLTQPKLAFWVFLGVTAYGGMIELVQPYFERQAEWEDMLADCFGAAIGASAGYWLSGSNLALSLRSSRSAQGK